MIKLSISHIQQKVLNALIDRYERRLDYASAEKNSRRTMLRIDKKSFPEYFHVSDSSFRHMFNTEMEALQAHGFVSLDWVRFDRGHTLEKIALQEDSLPRAYEALGRKSKKELFREAGKMLEGLKKEAPPEMDSFYDMLNKRVAAYEPLPSPLRVHNKEELTDLLKGLHAFFESRDDEVPRRVLSAGLYGDSKRWSLLEKGILHLLREFFLSEEEGLLNDSVILSERGIVDNPGHIYLAGPLIIATPGGGRVDLSLFEPDMGLPVKMARELEVVSCAVESVITIENLTAYYQYIKESPGKQLVIYLGGFPDKNRQLLMQKLYRFFNQNGDPVPFYHWGDIDLGGFRIWLNVKDRTGIPIEPYLMDEETYLNHLSSGQPIDEQYAVKLDALLKDNSYKIFHPLIKLMLSKKIRVEQEAVSLNINVTK